MSSLKLMTIAALLMLAGTALGMFIKNRVPNEHLSDETKDIVKLATGIIATIAGLVLSLLIATAKNSYDAVASDVKSAAADYVMLDRTLAQLGPIAVEPRRLFRQTLEIAAKTDLDSLAMASDKSDPLGQAIRLADQAGALLRNLPLTNPGDEWLRQRALSLQTDLSKSRWMLQQEESDVLPPPFLAVVILWLAIIFAGFGLFTPMNMTAIGALVIGALSIAASLFLINELNTPFYGVVRISGAPLMHSLHLLGPMP